MIGLPPVLMQTFGTEDFIPGGTGTVAQTQADTTSVFDKINAGISIAARLRSLFGDGQDSDQFKNMAGTSERILSRQPLRLDPPSPADSTTLARIFETVQGAVTRFPGLNRGSPTQTNRKTAVASQFLTPGILLAIGGAIILALVLRARRR